MAVFCRFVSVISAGAALSAWATALAAGRGLVGLWASATEAVARRLAPASKGSVLEIMIFPYSEKLSCMANTGWFQLQRVFMSLVEGG